MTHKNLLLAMLLAAATSLGACSSSDSDPIPNLPDPPAPPAPPASITVNGFVTDMPIPNATVVLTVNGQDFTAANPTGADGSYSVVIETTDTDALVECVAFDPDGPARFSALLDSFAGLQEGAGADGVLDDANITNVTTAQQLLAEALAVDGSIDDLAELQALAEQVDPAELLELAAAIKVVIDNVQGVVLPQEFEDVQQLAQAIVDGTSTFIADIETTNPGIIDDTVDEVINDGFATTPFVAESVPGVYIVTSGTEVLILMEDGSGYFAEDQLEGQLVEGITWSLTEGGALVLVFTEAQDTDTIVLLTDASGVQTVYVTPVEGGVEQASEAISLVRFGFDPDGFDAATVPGSYRDANSLDPTESQTEFTVLLVGGTGYDIDVATGVQDDFFTWAVTANAELTFTDDGIPDLGETVLSDENVTIRLLEGSTVAVRNLLVIEREFEGNAIIEIEALPIAYTSEIMAGPMADVANTLLLEGKTYAVTDGLDAFEKFLVTFEADGVFSEIFQEYSEEFGPEFGEENAATWFIDENGIIFITDPATDVDPQQTDLVTVVSGLGEDVMAIAVEEEGILSQLTLTLVTPFTANDNLTGTWTIFDEGVLSTETIMFNADGTGTYYDDGLFDVNFDWAIESSGRLVLTLDDGPNALVVFTDNLHRLADSTADNLHVFATYRADGVLDNDSDVPSGPPEVVFDATLVRQVAQ
jgi:hypothetical protein